MVTCKLVAQNVWDKSIYSDDIKKNPEIRGTRKGQLKLY